MTEPHSWTPNADEHRLLCFQIEALQREGLSEREIGRQIERRVRSLLADVPVQAISRSGNRRSLRRRALWRALLGI